MAQVASVSTRCSHRWHYGIAVPFIVSLQWSMSLQWPIFAVALCLCSALCHCSGPPALLWYMSPVGCIYACLSPSAVQNEYVKACYHDVCVCGTALFVEAVLQQHMISSMCVSDTCSPRVYSFQVSSDTCLKLTYNSMPLCSACLLQALNTG